MNYARALSSQRSIPANLWQNAFRGLANKSVDSAKVAAPKPSPAPGNTKPGGNVGPLAGDDTLKQIRAAFGSVEGDKNWNAKVDFDKDGEISVGDYSVYSKSKQAPRQPSELEMLQTAMGSVKGDDKYNEKVDYNRDGEVDAGDFALLSARVRSERIEADMTAFKAAYGSLNGDKNFNAKYDLDGDGEISVGDYSLLSAKYA